MKILQVIIAFALLILIFAYKSGAPPGSTCASNETSCATNGLCHTGTPNTGTGSYDISFMDGLPTNGYVPGTTYTLMPWVVDNTKSMFGFQMVAKKSDGTNAGAVSIILPSKTKLITDNGLEYVVQTTAGANINGIHDWMFDWTAPAAGSGKVTFYAAFVAADANGLSSGDLVYTDSLVIQEKPTSMDEYQNLENNISLFPNPVAHTVNIQLLKNIHTNFQIQIIDSKGNGILEQTAQYTNLLSNVYALDVSTLSNGMYFIRILNEGKPFALKRFAVIQ